MNAEAEGRAAAKRFRREHHLGVQPLGDLVAVIEQATGVDVAVLDATPDEHGLTMRDPERDAVFIGAARTRNPMRQRSSLGHELAHVVFEDWNADDPAKDWAARTPEESRADSFARHLLVPIEGVREFLGDQEEIGLASLSRVAQRFLVSPVIAAIALEQAGYITTATKQEWSGVHTSQLAARFGWSDQYHAMQADSYRLRAPQRLLARAIAGYTEGVLSAQAIATLRGIPLSEVEAELREAGIEPVERPVAWAAATDLPDVDVDPTELDRDLSGDRPGSAAEGHAG